MSLPGRPGPTGPTRVDRGEDRSAQHEGASTSDAPALELSASDRDELDERRLQVIAEQAAGLRWQVLLTVAVVGAVASTGVPTAWALAWILAAFACREARAVALARMVADRATPIARRLAATLRWNWLLGACHGSAALFMIWLDVTGSAVLTMILISLSAGAVSISAMIMRAFFGYAGPIFFLLATMWALKGGWMGWSIAVLTLMFLGVQMRFAQRNRNTFEESFRIRLENRWLALSLQAERTQLALARDVAEAANVEKSRFLATASHDLRQPLQAITLNSGELLRQCEGGDLHAMATDLHTSVEQLRTMLDALLDLSKLDAGLVLAQSRRVRLDQMVEGVTGGLGAAARAKGLALQARCPAGVVVHTDPDLLRRMLVNLLDNAIKFTAAGEVVLEVSVGEQGVEVAVRDTGPGIAQADQARVFEDLVQLDGPARAQGHGLGLGIVRRIAALLGTRIELQSAPGRGATFRWRLPSSADAAEGAAAAGPAVSLAGRRLLLLDDDTMVRGAYVTALAALGARSVTASSTAQALTELERERPDAAVVDFRLGPGEDGFGAAARLRERAPGLPIVMLTADSSTAMTDAARAHRLPLLRKPVDGHTLGHVLAEAIAGAQAQAPRPRPAAADAPAAIAGPDAHLH